MTKPLVTLPCTAQELETALHAVCDHDGLWDGKIYLDVSHDNDICEHRLVIETTETETKGEN